MTAFAPSAASSAALTVRLVANETLKGLQLTWRRRGLLVTFVVMHAVTFLGIRLLIGGGHMVTPLLATTLPALLAYAVAQTAAMQGSGGIAEEINGGTLAQSQLTPASPERQVLGRLTALAVEGWPPRCRWGWCSSSATACTITCAPTPWCPRCSPWPTGSATPC